MLSLKPFAALAAASAIAMSVSACGDDGAASPLDEALGFLPEDAGFVFIASTDRDDYDDVQRLVERFPFGGRLEDALRQSIESEGREFDRDVEPLLGNELVLGVADNERFVRGEDDRPFVLALETEDAGKARDFAREDATDEGESEGYDLFHGEGDSWIAVKDEVLVLSNDEQTLKSALEQRGSDDRLGEDEVEEAFEELPEDAPVRVYANVGALLEASPGAAEARKVKWVDHLEAVGVTAEVSEDAISIDYAITTDPEGLSDEDLPLAAGGDAPQLLERDEDSAEVAFGLRDPAQVVDFALAAGKVIDPAGYADYETGKAAFGRRLGIDVDEDVLAQLTGDVSAVAALDGSFGMRAELDDPDAFEGTLEKVMDGLPELADGVTVTRPRQGDRFYGVASEDGTTYAVGIAEGALVVANDAELASEVATRGLVDAEGQEGALVVAADAERLANAALSQFQGGIEGLGGSLFTGPLGELTASASASTDAVTGSLELSIED